MNLSQVKQRISDGEYDEIFAHLYGETCSARERYLSALDEFFVLYGDRDNIRVFSAPGRTEVGGNHTDHQHGLALAGSVNLDVIAVVSANNTNTVTIKSQGYNVDILDVDDLAVNTTQSGKAIAIIRGVLAAFKTNGYKIGGFDAYTTSNVLKGCGLSSSAAFEVLISNIVNGLFNNHSADAFTIAKYSHFAECEHFGKPCGLLDQMSSSVGGFTYIDFNDPKNPVVEKIDLDISSSGHTLCVVDTGGNHCQLTDDYADITTECKNISRALGVEFLRDASEKLFYEKITDLRKKFGDRAVLRAFHIFNENERVVKQCKALKEGKYNDFFALVNASGESSYQYLQNVYSIKSPNEQGISLALALTKQFLGKTGACRVHGGGFAGTIQAYIPNEKFCEYKQMIESVFGKGSCRELKIRSVGGCEIKLK